MPLDLFSVAYEFMMGTVLVCSGCVYGITEYYKLGGYKTTKIYFSQSWGLGCPRSRHQQIQCLACFLTDSHCLTVSSQGARDLSWKLFIRALNPFMRLLPSLPNHLPKVPPPNIITLGVRFQHMNFGGYRYSTCGRSLIFFLLVQ